jgi:hypothetical protein
MLKTCFLEAEESLAGLASSEMEVEAVSELNKKVFC